MKPLLTLVLLIAYSITVNAQQEMLYHRAEIFFEKDKENLRKLAGTGVDLTHVTHTEHSVISDFSEYELAEIKDAGFEPKILIRDIATYYASRNNRPASTAKMKGTTSSAPQNFHLGSYGGYYTYDEVLEELQSMAEKYPNLISSPEPIGDYKTIEGRPIYWVRMSDKPGTEQKRPQILYTALHHAREPGSISVLIYYMWHMLEQYDKDDRIKAIIDNTELYFIPCVNPDGYLYNIQIRPGGGGMWCKNRRGEQGRVYGVDLNRNYGYGWGNNDIGSSGSKGSDLYRGSSAFSEPETQAVKWFTETHHFGISLNLHTGASMLIYPWGDYYPESESSFRKTPDSNLYTKYGQVLTDSNGYEAGVTQQVLGYYTNGDIADWMYGETNTKNKVICLIPEVGPFYTHKNDIEYYCQLNLDANIRAAALLLPYASLNIVEVEGGLAKYNITELGLNNGEHKVSIHSPDGTFTTSGHINVHSGMKTLEKQDGVLPIEFLKDIDGGSEVRFFFRVDNGVYADTLYGQFVKEYEDKLQREQLVLYPNPAKDRITAFLQKLPDATIADCTFYDISGRRVLSFAITKKVATYSLASLRPGIYTIKVATENYGVLYEKLIITK